jgi:hypothetical protein
VKLADNRRFIVYEWNAWEGFLIAQLTPEATVVRAKLGDVVEDVVDRLPEGPASFLFHLDCTITRRFPRCRPELLEALNRRGVWVLNGAIDDISKKSIQQRCRALGLNSVTTNDAGDPDELIVVKTNLNYCGKNERMALSESERTQLGIEKVNNSIRSPDDYKVIPRREVNAEWWGDASLTLERFIENRENRYYRCFFFNGKIVLVEMENPEPIKKVGKSRLVKTWYMTARSDGLTHANPSDYPERAVDAVLKFTGAYVPHFATFDIVRDDEHQPYIIDVNVTPWFNVHVEVPRLVEHLRVGLSSENSGLADVTP